MDELGFYKSEVKRLEKANAALENRTYAAPHVWNLVAKVLRTEFSIYTGERGDTKKIRDYNQARRNAVTQLALSFAYRFTEDEGFDPLAFLDRCSPDTDLYPLSELWDENK